MKSNKSILLVDDDIDLVAILESLLLDDGYKVITAHSGNQAFKILQKNTDNIHLVLSDVRMPDGDGISLLKNIRELDPHKPLVILHTGYSEISRQEALDMGAIDLIQKPVNYEYIEGLLSSLFKDDEQNRSYS